MEPEEKCPKSEWLERLINGEVTEEQEATLSLHLDSCERCQHKLDRLTNVASIQLKRDSTIPFDDTWKGDIDFQNRLDMIREVRPSDTAGPANFQDALPWLVPMEGGLGRIAEFELVKFIGRGGMGIVFEAFDNKLHRHVALKMMSPGLIADPNASERFLREARAAAKINHVNVVTIHRVDEVRGLPYLVMELIDGHSIEDQLKKSPEFPVEQILKIARQTALGLEAAHRCGITHRDIKPSNLMLDRKSKRIKIADFGLAATVNENSFTRSGMLVGTPDFASPEQVTARQVDARSDLFSLGCVLFYLCAGQRPFAADSMIETLDAVRHKVLPAVDQLNHGIPGKLASVIDRLVQKHPDDRFQTAEELCAAIDQVAKVNSRQVLNEVSRSTGLSLTSKASAAVLAVILPGCLLLVALWFPGLFESEPSTNNPPLQIAEADQAAKKLDLVESGSGRTETGRVVESAEELLAAINDTGDDITIELSPGSTYRLDREILIRDRSVVILGDPESRPTIELPKIITHPAIHVEEGNLVLRGIRIDDLSKVDIDEPLVLCEHGELELADCRVRSTARESCLSLIDCELSVTDSVLVTSDTVIRCEPDLEHAIFVNNSIFASSLFIELESSPGFLRIKSADCDFLNWHVFGVHGGQLGGAVLSLESSRCRFFSQEALFMFQIESSIQNDEFVDTFFQSKFIWSGDSNIAPHEAASWHNEEDEGLVSWHDADATIPADTIVHNSSDLSVDEAIEELQTKSWNSLDEFRNDIEERADLAER